MAHFLIPPDSDGTGYESDSALAPGSVARVRMQLRSRKAIALHGGAGLWVRSKDKTIIDDADTVETAYKELRVFDVYPKAVGETAIQVGQGQTVWVALAVHVVERKSQQHTVIVRDVRLAGETPQGDVMEVDGNTPVRAIMEAVRARGLKHDGSMKVVFFAHGLPGFVQCGRGNFIHPQAGGGLSVADLNEFALLRGSVEDIVFYACLVARTGPSPECEGRAAYDGNQFCYLVARAASARVKASTHLQFYSEGRTERWFFRRPDGNGMRFGQWNGLVLTWDRFGRITKREEFPYVPVHERLTQPD